MESSDMPDKSQRRGFMDGIGEAASLFADSFWTHDVLPKAEMLTQKFAHVFGQKAGTETFARLEKNDPTDYDALYHDYIRPEIA